MYYTTPLTLIVIVLERSTKEQVTGTPVPWYRGIPEICNKPLPLTDNAHECCKTPPLFPLKDYEQCSFRSIGPAGPRMGQTSDMKMATCDKLDCLMDKYHLLKKDKTLDIVAAVSYLHMWSRQHRGHELAVNTTLDKCATNYFTEEIVGLCPSHKFMTCAAVYFLLTCQVWNAADHCRPLVEFMADCGDTIMTNL